MLFLPFLAISRIKLFKLGLFCTKHGTQYYLVYIIVLKCSDSKTIVMYLKLRAKLRCKCFLYFFGTFSHKVVQTLFVSHETNSTTLFGINYWVELPRIKNNSHMLEITCYVVFFKFFLAFLELSWIKLFKLALFCTKHGTQQYSVYIIVLKWLYSKTIVKYLKILAKLCF